MSPGRIRPGSAGSPDAPQEQQHPIEDPTAALAAEELYVDEFDRADEAEVEPILEEDDANDTASLPDREDELEETPEPSDNVVGTDDTDGSSAGELVAPTPAPAAPAKAASPRRARTGAASAEPEAEPLPLAATPPAVARQSRFRRLYYGETTFDFVRRKRIWFAISLIVIAAGSISLGVRGLNLGIEFVGGTSWTVESTTLSVQTTENALSNANVSGPTVVALGTGSSRSIEVQAKLPKGETAAQQEADATKVANILERVAHKHSINDVSIESVGPSWGGQVTHKALIALIVFFILIALYISVFFEWRMALAAIIAVLHDILVTVGIYSLSGFLVTPDTVVAFLTILGYSLYDTIVVFDRVRDNMKSLTIRDRLTFSDLVNLSMNQTIARSINTSLVAIMPIFAVLVLGAQILGATTLQYFGLALLIGLATGAYSSIFIASPLVAVMKEREPRYALLRERLEQRGSSRILLSAADVARGFTPEDSAPRSRAPRTATAQGGRVRPGSAAGVTTNGDATGADTAPAAAPVGKSTAPQRRPTARNRRRGGRR